METKKQSKVWFITGANRGLGRALAEAVVAAGDRVVGTSRAPASVAGVEFIALDLAYPKRIAEAMSKALMIHGRLDVIVNNAGYGQLGAVEEVGLEEAKRQMDVNFFSPFQIIAAALPYLRAQKSGHIINVSSIAGMAPMAGSGVYAASKFALAGLSDSLRQELAPLGIKVTLVEPGAFRTDFLSSHSLKKTGREIGDYASTAHKALAYLDGMAGTQLGDPARAAQAIIDLVREGKSPLHLLLGSDALKRARAKLGERVAETEEWAGVSTVTDFK